MTSWEGHSYMYTNARTLCQRHVSAGESVQARMASEAHYELPPVSEWKPWEGVAGVGHFHTEDLNATRAELLLSGRSPKVVLRNAAAADPVALRYMCVRSLDGETGACVIRELPPDRDAIEQFLERLQVKIPWCGEAIPGLTQKVLDQLLKADREQPAASKRAELL